MRLILVLFVITIFMFSCGGGIKTTDLNQAASEETIEGIPDWYLNVPDDPNYLFAPQSATSRDMNTAVQKATQAGRADIAVQLESRVDALTKSFTEEVGAGDDSEFLTQFTDVNKTVTSQTLYGTKVVKRDIKKENNIYRAYILMQMPVGLMQEEFVNEVKKREHLYTRMRASQSFQDLEEEVKKYEEKKANQ